VARETRQERRQRRAEQIDGTIAAPLPRTAPVRPAPEAPAAPSERRGFFGRLKRFVQESWAELRKVEWPRQQQVVSGTMVVLLACLIVGLYLYGADFVFRHLVQNVLLK